MEACSLLSVLMLGQCGLAIGAKLFEVDPFSLHKDAFLAAFYDIPPIWLQETWVRSGFHIWKFNHVKSAGFKFLGFMSQRYIDLLESYKLYVGRFILIFGKNTTALLFKRNQWHSIENLGIILSLEFKDNGFTDVPLFYPKHFTSKN